MFLQHLRRTGRRRSADRRSRSARCRELGHQRGRLRVHIPYSPGRDLVGWHATERERFRLQLVSACSIRTTLSQYIPALYPIKNAEKIANGEMDISELGVKATDDNTLVVDPRRPDRLLPVARLHLDLFPGAQARDRRKGRQVGRGREHRHQRSVHDDRVGARPADRARAERRTTTARSRRSPKRPTASTTIRRAGLSVASKTMSSITASRVDRTSSGFCADPALAAELIYLPAVEYCYFMVSDTTNRADRSDSVPAGALQGDRSRDAGDDDLQGRVPAGLHRAAGEYPGQQSGLRRCRRASTRRRHLLADAGIDPAIGDARICIPQRLAVQRRSVQYLQSAWQDNLGITIKLTPIEDRCLQRLARIPRDAEVRRLHRSLGFGLRRCLELVQPELHHAADHYQNHWSNAEFDQLRRHCGDQHQHRRAQSAVRQAEVILVERGCRSSRSCVARHSARSSRG